jgi:hypothetical protein
MWWPGKRAKGSTNMNVFSLEANDQIRFRKAAHLPTRKAGRHFTSEKEWTRIGGDLPMTRLVAIWNRLGVTPVQRFTSRQKALTRIWNAVQRLKPEQENESPQPAAAMHPKEREASSGDAPVQARESKKAQLLALLQVREGVSIDQLARVTGWQKHSIRGFLSGTIRRKMGLNLIAAKTEQGVRVYRIAL